MRLPDIGAIISRVAATSWNGFKVLLNVLHEASGSFPPLDATVGGLLALIEVYDVSTRSMLTRYLPREMRSGLFIIFTLAHGV